MRGEGVWAGERLRICCVDEVVEQEGWVDVTKEVSTHVGRFLERTYPGDVLEDYADYYGPSI